MRPFKGLLAAGPLDGVLRGRLGVLRWVCQVTVVAAIGLAVLVVTLVLLAKQSLTEFIIVLAVAGVLALSLRACHHLWAWAGMDWTVPILFDLREDGLEAGSWNFCFLETRRWPLADLQDLRVYTASADYADSKDADITPLQDPAQLKNDLPGIRDVAKEFVNIFWSMCMSRRFQPTVACAFLGAEIKNEEWPVRLSRDVWSAWEVKVLWVLAQACRRKAGLPEALPSAAVAPGGASKPTAAVLGTGSAAKADPEAWADDVMVEV